MSFPGLEFVQLLERVRRRTFSRLRRWLNSQNSLLLKKIKSEPIIGHVVMSAVHAAVYFALNNAEKYVPYGESLGTTECVMLYPRRRTNRGRYNRVRLYFSVVLA